MSGAEYRSVYATSAMFDGFAVANSDLLVKYTYNGDFDYNGKIDGADYALIDAAFNSQSGTLHPPGVAVPEPGLSRAIVITIAVTRRRRCATRK